MLIKNNLTGRKFVCLGLSEKLCYGWKSSFTLERLYYEHENKDFDESNILVEKDILFLFDDNGDLKYVDTKEFTEVELESVEFRRVISTMAFSLN